MKKLAIFAEGGTEQHFAERLLREIAQAKHLRIEKTKIRGGASFPRTNRRIHIDVESDTQKFFVQIIDCGTDGRVQSDIRDNYKALCRQNFSSIIGIRDTYPNTGPNLQKIKDNLYYGLKTAPLKPTMVLAIQEIEAWFLAEYTHFLKIRSSLTLDVISQTLSFDPSVGDVETRPHPAADLNTVYQTVGEAYDKTPNIIQRTINALDCERIFLELPDRISSLKHLIVAMEDFLAN